MVARGADLRHGLGFDLADSFARHRETPSNFFERQLAIEAEPVPKTKYFALAVGEGAHRVFDLLGELASHGVFFRGATCHIAHQMAEWRFFALTDRRFERGWVLGRIEQQFDLPNRHADAGGKLVRARLTSQLSEELGSRLRQFAQRLDDMNRQPDRPPVVRHGASDLLTDPPRRVRRELEAAAVLK